MLPPGYQSAREDLRSWNDVEIFLLYVIFSQCCILYLNYSCFYNFDTPIVMTIIETPSLKRVSLSGAKTTTCQHSI